MSTVYYVLSFEKDDRLKVEMISEETLVKRLVVDKDESTFYGKRLFFAQDPDELNMLHDEGKNTLLILSANPIVVTEKMILVGYSLPPPRKQP